MEQVLQCVTVSRMCTDSPSDIAFSGLGKLLQVEHCTVFRKAYILSGSGFHEFLYSIIESLRKIREIAEFIPNQLRFHEKKL